MKFLRNITWDEVYENWRKAETAGDVWRKFYEGRGFETWEEFRGRYLDKTDLPEREWKLYEIDPKEVFSMHCGPFPGWEGLAADLGASNFGTLSLSGHFDQHEKMQSILADFPREVQLIGIQLPDPSGKPGDPSVTKIRIFEGHHRAVALCRMLEAGTPPDTKITLALCEMDELPELTSQ